MADIILASSSPRRRELMALVCTDYKVITGDVDESAVSADSPCALALKLAKLKCKVVADTQENSVVIGCDTVVEIDGKALGKPKDKLEAQRMMSDLSGKTHAVHTGVAINCNGQQNSFTVSTNVKFAKLSQAEIDEYISTDEPYDKAGGYGIQGKAAKFIEGIDGCYYNVMGFPVQKVYDCLRALGAL